MSPSQVVWYRVADTDELDDALIRALDHDGPSTVEILTDPQLI